MIDRLDRGAGRFIAAAIALALVAVVVGAIEAFSFAYACESSDTQDEPDPDVLLGRICELDPDGAWIPILLVLGPLTVLAVTGAIAARRRRWKPLGVGVLAAGLVLLVGYWIDTLPRF